MLKKRIFIFTSYTERLREFGHDFEFDANVWLSFWAQVWSRLWRWIFDKLAIWLKSNYFGESTFKWLKPLCQLCLWKWFHYEPELRFKGACLLQIRSFRNPLVFMSRITRFCMLICTKGKDKLGQKDKKTDRQKYKKTTRKTQEASTKIPMN